MEKRFLQLGPMGESYNRVFRPYKRLVESEVINVSTYQQQQQQQ